MVAKANGKLTLHLPSAEGGFGCAAAEVAEPDAAAQRTAAGLSLTDLLGRELAKGYDVLHLEQMSTGWLGIGVARALLNVHYFDVIDWAERENMTFADRKALWQAQRATKHLLHGINNVRLLTPRLKEAGGIDQS